MTPPGTTIHGRGFHLFIHHGAHGAHLEVAKTKRETSGWEVKPTN
jgi:hypothetical protein